jgi:adenylate cyclase
MADEGLITFEKQYPNMGIYAVMANMILSGEFLDDAPPLVSIIIALIFCFALAFIIKRLSTAWSLMAGIFGLFLCGGGGLLFFMFTKIYIGMAFPLISLSLTFLSLSGMNFLSTSREKQFIRSAFSRYLAPNVIEQIIADPSKLNLGGEKREMTAIFTDIRSFSTISEALGDPSMLVQLLNFYLTRMSNIVMKNQGTIDKYEGDAIIAFFGAPLTLPNHAELACRSVVQMKKAEIIINKEAIEQGLITEKVIESLLKKGIIKESERAAPLFTRLGVNTGAMVVGNMGTPDKMDYTIMGDAVNLAARLEGVNKQYNTRGILISEYTRAQIGSAFLLRKLDSVRVVGKNEPIRLYELFDSLDDASPEDKKAIELFHQGLDIFEKRDWSAAKGFFEGVLQFLPGDGVASLYRKRCEQYQLKPPAANWDGVYNLDQK